MRHLMACCCIILLLTSCAPTTTIQISIDLRSYLSDDLLSASFGVPETSGVTVYILPGLQVDDAGAGPDEDMRQGLQVDIPGVPAESGLRISVSVEIDIANTSGINTLAPWSVDVVVAPADASNLYVEGVTIATLLSPSLPPGSVGSVHLLAAVEDGDAAYDIFQSGQARIGVTAGIGPSVGGTANALMSIEEITVDVSFRAYSIFRLF